jgi:beta-fructofuranosidase
MTIPRELYWQGDSLAQRPVAELASYRGAEVKRNLRLTGTARIEGVEGQRLDLEICLRTEGEGRAGVRVFLGIDERTEISWDTRTNWLTLDRSHGGNPIRSTSTTYPDCQVYKAKVNDEKGTLRLRLILDRSSLELFAQGGTTVMTSTLYPKASSSGIEFFGEGCGFGLECRAWPLLPAHEAER